MTTTKTKRSKSRRKNPSSLAIAGMALAGVAAASVGYLAYKKLAPKLNLGGPKPLPSAEALADIVVPGETLEAAPFVVKDVRQPIRLATIATDQTWNVVPELQVFSNTSEGPEVRRVTQAQFGTADDEAVLITDEYTPNGNFHLTVNTGEKAITRLVTNLSGDAARLAYELALVRISKGVEWTDPAPMDQAIEEILSKVAPKMDWTQRLGPHVFGSAPYVAWTAVQLLGTVAAQSYYNKLASKLPVPAMV